MLSSSVSIFVVSTPLHLLRVDNPGNWIEFEKLKVSDEFVVLLYIVYNCI